MVSKGSKKKQQQVSVSGSKNAASTSSSTSSSSKTVVHTVGTEAAFTSSSAVEVTSTASPTWTKTSQKLRKPESAASNKSMLTNTHSGTQSQSQSKLFKSSSSSSSHIESRSEQQQRRLQIEQQQQEQLYKSVSDAGSIGGGDSTPIASIMTDTMKSTKASSSSSSFQEKSEYYEEISNDFSNAKIISSIDLLESDKKEPVFSVPIDVIEIVGSGSSSLGSNYNKAYVPSSQSQTGVMTSTSSSNFAHMESANSSSKVIDGGVTISDMSTENSKSILSTSNTAKSGKVTSTNVEMTSSSNKFLTNDVSNRSAQVISYTSIDGQAINGATTPVIASLITSPAKTQQTSTAFTKSTRRAIDDDRHSITSTAHSEFTTQGDSTAKNLKSDVVESGSSKQLASNVTNKLSKKSSIIEQNISEQTIEESSLKKSKSTSKKEVYDIKTKRWTELNEKTGTGVTNKKQPTIERYVSRESDGTYKITYKKKIFDQRANKWKIVEEKTVDSAHDTHYPEIVDDVINTTTTTYTTKVYDTKTGEWKIVEEKSFVDSKAFVPNDIVREIEKDNTDLANITTTTEVTKVINYGKVFRNALGYDALFNLAKRVYAYCVSVSVVLSF